VYYLKFILICAHDLRKEFMDRDITRNTSLTILKIDQSYEVLNSTNMKTLFKGGLLTAIDQMDCVRIQALLLDNTDEQKRPLFARLAENMKHSGSEDGLQLVFTDRCCQDRGLLEDCFPSLNGHPLGYWPSLGADLPFFPTINKMPDFVVEFEDVLYCSHRDLVPRYVDAIHASTARQRESGHAPFVFIDTEADVYGPHAGLCATLQIAYLDSESTICSVVFHLPKLCTAKYPGEANPRVFVMPESLKILLEHDRIAKVYYSSFNLRTHRLG
jgi:hypothetical protein